MNDTTKLDCFVIAPESQSSNIELLSMLKSDNRLNVIHFPAIMINKSTPYFVNLAEDVLTSFKLQYGRLPLPGEIGCSLSHNAVRAFSGNNLMGALIVEDDAQISDVKNLVSDSIDFLSNNQSKARVLSFYNNEYKLFSRREIGSKRSWIRYFGAPSSTVAYALTGKAANMLVSANQPLRYLADWPISRVKYFISTKNLVGHPQDPDKSQIGNRITREAGFTRAQKLEIFFFIYWISHRKQFRSFSVFFCSLWWPRLQDKMNRLILGRLIRK